MAAISPTLDTLLNHWVTDRREREKRLQEYRDGLKTAELQLAEERQMLRQRQKTETQALSHLIQNIERRWTERLRRIEEWQTYLSHCQTQERETRAFFVQTGWWGRIDLLRDNFIRRIAQRADFLHEQNQDLRDHLTTWIARLEEHQKSLEEFKNREIAKGRPILVSRARKNLEITFLRDERRQHDLFYHDLQQQRQSLNQLIGRLQKARSALKAHAQNSRLLFEIRRPAIESALNQLGQALQECREEMLNTSLLFASGRRLWSQAEEIIRPMRCIEEAYRTPEPFWKRWWS